MAWLEQTYMNGQHKYWTDTDTGEITYTQPSGGQVVTEAPKDTWTSQTYMDGQHTYFTNDRTGEIHYGNEAPLTVKEQIQRTIGSATDPYQQAQALLSSPGGWSALHYATQNGLVQWKPEFGDIIARGQASEDNGGFGGIGNLFSSGNILETLVDPGNAQDVVKGTLQNLQEGKFADPLGVVDSFRGDEAVQPVDYLGQGRFADTEFMPVGRMMGRMMANVGAAAAMGGGTDPSATTAADASGPYGGFDNAAISQANYTGVPGTPGAPGTFTESGLLSTESAIAGQPADGLTWDQIANQAPPTPTAPYGGFDNGAISGAQSFAPAAAPVAADALNSSSGSSSSGAPSGGSSSGGPGGSASGGGSGGSSWLNAGNWMNSIFGQNGEIDWWRLAGNALPGLLGAFASGSQAEDLEDLSHEFKQMGAPYRTRLEQLYTNPQAFLNSPEVMEPIKQGTNALAHSLSVKGNPAGSGNALQELQNYASTQLFSRLGAEKDRLAGFGGLTQYSAAAPQTAQNSVAAQRGVYDALGGMAADVFNPPKRYRLEDLLRGFNG